MEKKNIFGILCLLVILVISACTNSKPEPSFAADSVQEEFAKKTSSGEVTIELQPKEYANLVLDVDISMNTHSVDMSQFDLKKQVKLVVGEKEYAPVEAPGLSGHHNSGTLRFKVPEKPSAYSIIIRGIPDIEERVFQWP